MDVLFGLGMVAAFLTTMSFLPQVIKATQSKHTKDISLMMYILFSAGLALWIVYGICLKSPPVILANTITLGLGLYMIVLKIKYK